MYKLIVETVTTEGYSLPENCNELQTHELLETISKKEIIPDKETKRKWYISSSADNECKWTQTKEDIFISSCNKNIQMNCDYDMQRSFIYCPHCGRRIKLN